jgi:hypothetical protein
VIAWNLRGKVGRKRHDDGYCRDSGDGSVDRYSSVKLKTSQTP